MTALTIVKRAERFSSRALRKAIAQQVLEIISLPADEFVEAAGI